MIPTPSSEAKFLYWTPLLPLDRVFNIIHQEEKHKKAVIGCDNWGDSAMAFTVDGHSQIVKKGLARFVEYMVIGMQFAMK